MHGTVINMMRNFLYGEEIPDIKQITICMPFVL